MKLSIYMAQFFIFCALGEISAPRAYDRNFDLQDCGFTATTHRILDTGPRGISFSSFTEKATGQSDVATLMGTIVWKSRSYLLVAAGRWDAAPKKKSYAVYMSSNQGRSWTRYQSTCLFCSDVSAVYGLGILRSHLDPKILYERFNYRDCRFNLSSDGGVSWSEATPILNNKHIDEFDIIETGMRLRNRVYARIKERENNKTYLCVSNDYGASFNKLSDDVFYAVESRAQDSLLFGVKDKTHQLVVSTNGGLTWSLLPGGDILLTPVYRDIDTHTVRTWQNSPRDEEVIWPRPIEQIETDPTNPDLIYVLTWQGLYRSMDRGKTFRLMPLRTDMTMSIDSISVDPIAGKHVYAQVDLSSIYHSNDKGCSWERLPFPK
jgi:hypothetical protein